MYSIYDFNGNMGLGSKYIPKELERTYILYDRNKLKDAVSTFYFNNKKSKGNNK